MIREMFVRDAKERKCSSEK